MELKQLLFIVLFNNTLFSQIDSINFDLTTLYQKLGKNVSYVIKDFNFREKFCIIKTKDSLEYIIKPDDIHGPFKKVFGNFNLLTLFEVETITNEYATYSTKLNTFKVNVNWCDDYDEEWTKSIILYANKPIIGHYIIQQNGKMYGLFDNKPDLLWSNDTSTTYQVFKKDNKHFELFKNHTSLGNYKLYKCRYCGKGDYDLVYLNMFSNKFGNQFLVQNDSLFGPLKILKNAGISYVNGDKYFSSHLIQNKNEDFCRLYWNKKDFGFQLTNDATEILMFPDSSIIIKAEYLKKYEFLKKEPEIYFYHSKFGLIDPPPIEKNKLVLKTLQPQIISNTNFCLTGLYGENLKEMYLYKKNKFIDAVSTFPLIIDNNYFYEKDWDYYMNGEKINLPKNDGFCVYNIDTFYVVKTSNKTWNLFKNRILQNTQKVDINDNIKSLRFIYYPIEKQLILSINTGYPNQFTYEKECPNKCYFLSFDIYNNKMVKNINEGNSEYEVSLRGGKEYFYKYITKKSFEFQKKIYNFNLSKNSYYHNFDYEGIYLKQYPKNLIIYCVKS